METFHFVDRGHSNKNAQGLAHHPVGKAVDGYHAGKIPRAPARGICQGQCYVGQIERLAMQPFLPRGGCRCCHGRYGGSMEFGWLLCPQRCGGPLCGASALKERRSAALAGFLCLDLFQMCAHQTCVKMKLPKGSCFLAPQTVHNLQGTALATVVICATKDTGFEPWSFDHCRLSEISVEEYFGMLRSRSSNSQLSTRGYFYASALQAMRSNYALNKTKRKPEVQKGQSRLTELEPIAGHFS